MDARSVITLSQGQNVMKRFTSKNLLVVVIIVFVPGKDNLRIPTFFVHSGRLTHNSQKVNYVSTLRNFLHLHFMNASNKLVCLSVAGLLRLV